ncbi:MAG: PD-(D/E)XK nuclease family protein [Anaerolineae bacterium]|nr:PD-(D/E)XK nuclease family protein [Anaerolineae bacterium]
MSLPSDFQFSQSSLQDFADCPKRFQLRYLLNMAWPAVETEPIEEHERRIQHGLAFHRMVQQHILGLPEERLSSMATEGDLARWWAAYRTYRPADLPGTRYPEVTLTTPVPLPSNDTGARLVAKYDLLVIQPDSRAVILDWKTSQKRTRSVTLKNRLQTRVYRYLIVKAGAYLNAGQAFEPEQITMTYWFSDFPDSPERLPYTTMQYHDDAQYLAGLVAQIAALEQDGFTLTDNEQRCAYCLYRSYCERGVHAGQIGDLEDEPEAETADLLNFDFEQIAEIAF